MRKALESLPVQLQWAMAGTTLVLILTLLALGFVWFAMDTD